MKAINDISLTINNEALELDYSRKTGQVTYSIADFAGNVLLRGKFQEEKRIPISGLSKGIYTLCIVDGDVLIKNRFMKDQ